MLFFWVCLSGVSSKIGLNIKCELIVLCCELNTNTTSECIMGKGRPRKVADISENDVLLNASETTTDCVGEKEPSEPKKQEEKNNIFTIQNKTLKNITISCLDGIEVKFDDKGIAEIEEKRIADYLLKIPSYKQI